VGTNMKDIKEKAFKKTISSIKCDWCGYMNTDIKVNSRKEFSCSCCGNANKLKLMWIAKKENLQ
jgi:ribosomal protein L44E